VADTSDGERPDMQRSLERDVRRLARREGSGATFWRSLSALGTVGWAIALPTAGGAWLGHRIDERYGTGIHFTLILLVAGLFLGVALAWHALGRHHG
jgi:ATP synthase protein I